MWGDQGSTGGKLRHCGLNQGDESSIQKILKKRDKKENNQIRIFKNLTLTKHGKAWGM